MPPPPPILSQQEAPCAHRAYFPVPSMRQCCGLLSQTLAWCKSAMPCDGAANLTTPYLQIIEDINSRLMMSMEVVYKPTGRQLADTALFQDWDVEVLSTIVSKLQPTLFSSAGHQDLQKGTRPMPMPSVLYLISKVVLVWNWGCGRRGTK